MSTTLTMDQVRSVRAHILAHPELSPKEQHTTCGVDMALCSFYSIRNNHSFVDHSYTPPPKRTWNRYEIVDGRARCNRCGEWKPLDQFRTFNKWLPKSNRTVEYRHKLCRSCKSESFKVAHYGNGANTVKQSRLASIDCPFHCPTCGGAYPEKGNEPFQTMKEAMRCCRNVELDAKEESNEHA